MKCLREMLGITSLYRTQEPSPLKPHPLLSTPRLSVTDGSCHELTLVLLLTANLIDYIGVKLIALKSSRAPFSSQILIIIFYSVMALRNRYLNDSTEEFFESNRLILRKLTSVKSEL